MLRDEIRNKLNDTLFLTQLSAKLNKPYPTVRGWVVRNSSKLTEITFLQVLAKMLDKKIEELINS